MYKIPSTCCIQVHLPEEFTVWSLIRKLGGLIRVSYNTRVKAKQARMKFMTNSYSLYKINNSCTHKSMLVNVVCLNITSSRMQYLSSKDVQQIIFLLCVKKATIFFIYLAIFSKISSYNKIQSLTVYQCRTSTKKKEKQTEGDGW